MAFGLPHPPTQNEHSIFKQSFYDWKWHASMSTPSHTTSLLIYQYEFDTMLLTIKHCFVISNQTI